MRKLLYLANALYGVLLLLGSDSISLLIVGTITNSLNLFYQVSKGESLRNILLFMASVNIFCSGTNILGSSYALLPISWFNIWISLFILTGIAEVLFSMRYLEVLDILLLFTLISAIPATMVAINSPDAIRDFLNLTVFLLAILTRPKRVDKSNIFQGLTISAFAAATIVIVQCVLFLAFGVKLGNLVQPQNRIAFGGIFMDISHFSLFFASVAALYYKRKPLIFLFYFAASVATSARTGVVAFLAYTVLDIATSKSKAASKIRSIAWIICSVATALYLFSYIRPDILTETGRLKSFTTGLSTFMANPLVGVGLGIENYEQTVGVTIPHNAIIQFLAQGGIILGVPFSLVYILLFRLSAQALHVSPFAASLFIVLVGGLFVPEITNSRFIIPVAIACLAELNLRRKQ